MRLRVVQSRASAFEPDIDERRQIRDRRQRGLSLERSEAYE